MKLIDLFKASMFFHNCTRAQATTYLANKPIDSVVMRTCSEGNSFLALTFKLNNSDDPYLHALLSFDEDPVSFESSKGRLTCNDLNGVVAFLKQNNYSLLADPYHKLRQYNPLRTNTETNSRPQAPHSLAPRQSNS